MGQLGLREIRGEPVVGLDFLFHDGRQVGSLELAVVDAALGGREQFPGEGLYHVVLSGLHVVFQRFHLEGNERNDTLREAAVDEVVAQREVEQLAFPQCLFGNLSLLFVQVKRIVVQMLDVFRHGVVLHAVVHESAAVGKALGQGLDAVEATVADIDEEHECTLVANLLFGFGSGIFKAGGRR